MEEVHESGGAIYKVVREANAAIYNEFGFRGRLYRAVDALKSIRVPSCQVNIAENISATLPAFERTSLDRDEKRCAADRNPLRALEKQWLCAPAPQS